MLDRLTFALSINRIINMHQILNFPADLIHELYEVYRQTMADVINQARYFRRLAMEITFQNNLLAAGYEEEDDRRYGPGF